MHEGDEDGLAASLDPAGVASYVLVLHPRLYTHHLGGRGSDLRPGATGPSCRLLLSLGKSLKKLPKIDYLVLTPRHLYLGSSQFNF